MNFILTHTHAIVCLFFLLLEILHSARRSRAHKKGENGEGAVAVREREFSVVCPSVGRSVVGEL